MHHSCWTTLLVFGGLAFSLILTVPHRENPGSGLTAMNQLQDGGGSQAGRQDPEAIARRDYMRVKLMFTQNIIEGLTMKNFETIRQAGEEIRNVAQGPVWNAIDSDEYRSQSREFQRSVDSLVQSTERGNIDATTMRFFAMTTKCVDCHEHLRMRADF